MWSGRGQRRAFEEQILLGGGGRQPKKYHSKVSDFFTETHTFPV